jgi:hypothetical protein
MVRRCRWWLLVILGLLLLRFSLPCSISLVGHELTYSQFAVIFPAKTGQQLLVSYRVVGSAFMAMVKDMGYMFRCFRDEGYKAGIGEVKRRYLGFMIFGTWLERESAWAKR